MGAERNANELERDLATMPLGDLEEAVKLHNYRYWVENNATIPDILFDKLVERLRELAPESPVLDAIGAEGAGELAGASYGEKVEHEAPMLSLEKAYDEESVGKWFDRFEGECVGSPKVDGIACSLRYRSGRLALAATRGNGVRGDVITPNAKMVHAIPHQIDSGDIEVRGEVYMPRSVFERYAAEYANPRNLAAGAIKHKDPESTRGYDLRFFAYDLRGEDHETEEAKFQRLTELGFNPVEWRRVARDEIQSFYDGIVVQRQDADYEMDGVVFRANLTAEQSRMGLTAHHPRFAIAYKFQGESDVSTLEEVEWSVSRTGAINPVAVVAPVLLSGATVTRASLHNLAFMESLELTLGSTLLMTRRGGVIPHVEKVTIPGEGEIAVPETCPSCSHGPTERRGDFLYCTNPDGCSQVQLTLLKHFVNAIDCKGFGPKIIEQLYDAGALLEPADFYKLTIDELVTLERMGKTLAGKLVGAVAEKTTLSHAAFLKSLAIPDLGNVASKDVAAHFLTLEATRAASAEDIAAIHGLGETTGETIHKGLVARTTIIDNLLEHVTVTDAEPKTDDAGGDGPLAGLQFLFTGTLASMKRKEAQTKVRDAGGATPDGIKKDLDYLVIGDADLEKFNGGWRSSKLKKAEKFNGSGGDIKIIGETAFLAMLD